MTKRYWKAQSILGYNAPIILTAASTQSEAREKMLIHLKEEVASPDFTGRAALREEPYEISQADYHYIKRITLQAAKRLGISDELWLSQLAPDTFGTISEG